MRFAASSCAVQCWKSYLHWQGALDLQQHCARRSPNTCMRTNWHSRARPPSEGRLAAGALLSAEEHNCALLSAESQKSSNYISWSSRCGHRRYTTIRCLELSPLMQASLVKLQIEFSSHDSNNACLQVRRHTFKWMLLHQGLLAM